MRTRVLLLILSGVLLAGCAASMPTGPSVLVLPGSGKDFDQFRTDDAVCHRWALQQCGAATAQTPTDTVATGAAVGTVLGAATGAAVGAAAGDAATGAAVGSGIGLLGGTAAGADRATGEQWSMQRRYDIAYMQCMYARGNQIPVSGVSQRPPPPPSSPEAPPSRPSGVPPPPPGSPPPPPPGAGW